MSHMRRLLRMDRDNVAGYVIVGLVVLGALVCLAAAIWLSWQAQRLSGASGVCDERVRR